MSEHKDNPNSALKAELTEEQKKYQAEIEAKQAEFRKLLDTPLAKDEAEKALAENQVTRANIKSMVRQCEIRFNRQMGDAEARLAELDAEDAIIRRRMLNGAK